MTQYRVHGESGFQDQEIERLSEEWKHVKELEKNLRNTEMELEAQSQNNVYFCRVIKNMKHGK